MAEYIERPQNRHLIHDSETNRRRATKHGRMIAKALLDGNTIAINADW